MRLNQTFATTVTSLLLVLACSPRTLAATGSFGQTPLYFTENKGQWDERVLFKADGGAGLTWWFERDGLTLAVTVPDSQQIKQIEQIRESPMEWKSAESVKSVVPSKGHALKLRFVPSPTQQTSDLVLATDATDKNVYPPRQIEVIPEGKLGWNNNYFLGNDSSKWAPDCGNFTRLTYREVWPGIDVVYYGEGDRIKYDYVVKPGADPADVRLRWLGLNEPLAVGCPHPTAEESRSEAMMPQGDDTLRQALFLATSVGTLKEGIPAAYQRDDAGGRVPVEVGLKVLSENEVGLEVKGDWDRERELVVDPLVWSTYLGGNTDDDVVALISDGAGGVVAAGCTRGGFPTTEGAFDRRHNYGGDIFVARMSANGSDLIYSTYLGGFGDDLAYELVPDGEGGVILSGSTACDDFPTPEGSYDRSYNGGEMDGIVARLSADGSQLLYGTYLGGEDYDFAYAITPDGAGGVVVAGCTLSDDFPTTEGAFDRSFNSNTDIFVAKLNANGSELVFSSYFGGHGGEGSTAISCNDNGDVVIAGATSGENFPTTVGAFDRSYDGTNEDAFVARISQNGSELLYSTYLGGGGYDYATALVSDGEGGVFVTGSTRSNRFPTTEGAFDRSINYYKDAFVVRLSEDGSQLLFGTYLGGNKDDVAEAIILDGTGGVVLAGYTWSSSFPSAGEPIERSPCGRSDAFVARFSGDGSELLYGTFFGGDLQDQAHALALDRAGGVFLAGDTRSENFRTTEGAFDETYNDNDDYDGFIAQIEIGLPFIIRWIEMPHIAACFESDILILEVHGEQFTEQGELTLQYHSDDIPADFADFEDFGDGLGALFWETTYDDAGEYLVTFTLSDGENEISADVVIIVNNVNRAPVWDMPPPDMTAVDEGEELVITVAAIDSDNDSLLVEVQVQGLPEGWQFTDNGDGSGRFVWTPGFEDGGANGAYLIGFIATDGDTSIEASCRINVNDATSVRDPFILHPSSFILLPPFPNPFNSSTTIRFGLPVAGEVSLKVTDLSGKMVVDLTRRFGDRPYAAGWHEAVWNAEGMAAGVYLVKLEAGGGEFVQKVVLTR